MQFAHFVESVPTEVYIHHSGSKIFTSNIFLLSCLITGPGPSLVREPLPQPQSPQTSLGGSRRSPRSPPRPPWPGPGSRPPSPPLSPQPQHLRPGVSSLARPRHSNSSPTEIRDSNKYLRTSSCQRLRGNLRCLVSSNKERRMFWATLRVIQLLRLEEESNHEPLIYLITKQESKITLIKHHNYWVISAQNKVKSVKK